MFCYILKYVVCQKFLQDHKENNNIKPKENNITTNRTSGDWETLV